MSMTLRTDDELDDALNRLSELEGRSKQEVVRRAVLERLDATDHRARVAGAAADGMARWKDVLDRLGSV